MALRLLLDENLSSSHASWLRSLNYDAVSVMELKLGGSTDGQIWAEARRLQASIVTLDSDFASLLKFPLEESPGVIWLKLSQPTEAAIRSALNRVLVYAINAGLNRKLLVVEERSIRFRTA